MSGDLLIEYLSHINIIIYITKTIYISRNNIIFTI